MISKKIIYGLLLPLIIIILASCHGSTEREWSVKNESSTTIDVWARLESNADTVHQVVEKGETKILTITTEDRGISDSQQPYEVFRLFLIKNEAGEIFTRDYADIHDWDVFIEQTKSNPPQYFQTYTMIVTNADF